MFVFLYTPTYIRHRSRFCHHLRERTLW